MRFGLIGTGYWAEVTHGRGLAEAPGVELEAVWGRHPVRTADIAARLGVTACRSVDELFQRVDAVAFAVPPDVQARLAVQAADAGRHLLLEKPIATSVDDARRLREAVDRAQVASVVFFTARFDPGTVGWLAAADRLDWEGGWSRWLVSGLSDPSSPYSSSAWRRRKGALWDVGPHALSLLVPALGPVTAVHAAAGARDLVHLVLEHRGGATSTCSLTLMAPPPTSNIELALWGRPGVSVAPRLGMSPASLLGEAARQVVSAAGTPEGHPCDVHFGELVVGVLAEAERALARDRRPPPAREVLG